MPVQHGSHRTIGTYSYELSENRFSSRQYSKHRTKAKVEKGCIETKEMSCLYRHEMESGMQWPREHGNKKKTGAKESYCKMNSQVRGWIAACNSAQPTNLHLMSLSRVRGRTLALCSGSVQHINNTLFAIGNFHVHEQLHFCYVTSHACTTGVVTKFVLPKCSHLVLNQEYFYPLLSHAWHLLLAHYRSINVLGVSEQVKYIHHVSTEYLLDECSRERWINAANAAKL